MPKAVRLPIALTIAGSDSGGGAGIQADLKTFSALGVHGTSAITCITAQNPCGVHGILPATPRILRQQIETVFGELPPAACKTGMLLSAELINVVAALFRKRGSLPLVVDPVMIATSGARLLRVKAIRALTEKLLPLATLVTPNVHEAQLLLDTEITTPEALRGAARRLQARFGCAALVKGGHLIRTREATDFFYDGSTELMLTAPFIRGISTHGTGCTYSAAVTAFLARGYPLPDAVARAKKFVTNAIGQSVRVGGHFALNWLARMSRQTPPRRRSRSR
jgi:hydroxymethylpyrimidine/phosphomethylpyrimidine kinase